MTKKYLSLEHAIRNAVRDQQYKKKSINEDFEFEMARNELRTAIDAAKRLMAHVDGEGELEAWVQSKITKASDYLDTVADYMDSGDKKKIKEHTEEIMETVGIVGGEFKGRQFNNVVPKITPDSTRPALKTSSVRRNAKENKSLTVHGKITELAVPKTVIDLIGGGAKTLSKTLSADAKVATGVSTATKGAGEAQAATKAASGAKDVEAFAPTKPKPVEEPVAPTKPEIVPSKPDTTSPVKAPTTNEPVKAPDVATSDAAAPATETKTKTSLADITKKAALGTAAASAANSLLGGGFSYQAMPQNISSTRNAQTYKSHADAPRQFKEENGEERKKVEYVARKNAAGPKSSKSTLGRTGSVQTKIIDEHLANIVKNVVKKKKEEKESGGQNPLVDFDPKLNHTIRNESVDNLLEAPGDTAFDNYSQSQVDDLIQKNPGAKEKINKKWQEAQDRKAKTSSEKPSVKPEAPSAKPSSTSTAAPTAAAPESTLSKVGKGALKVVDKAAAPLQFGVDYYDRKQEGQSTGKALTGAASSTAGMIGGAKVGAALGSAFGPVGTAVGGIGGGIVGAIGGGKLHDYVADKIDNIPAAEPDALAKEKADKVSALKAGTFVQKYGDKDEEKESGSKKKVNESSLIDAFLQLHGKNK